MEVGKSVEDTSDGAACSFVCFKKDDGFNSLTASKQITKLNYRYSFNYPFFEYHYRDEIVVKK